MTSQPNFRLHLNDILDNQLISIHFQPIFDSQQEKLLGYEALSRGPKGHVLSNPEDLFDCAHSLGKLSELELLCRQLSIKRFAQLKLDGMLFLNVSPYVIEQQSHPSGETLKILNEYNLSPERVVIEVTEKFEADNNALLKASLEHYRELGFKIAIDDLGTGHSGLKQWAELRPDIVKIDRYFISDCHKNIVKRELLRTIFELGKATNVSIIAEGIEHAHEYLLLQKLGMTFAQGYLLAKPQAQPINIFPNKLRQESRVHQFSRQTDREEFELAPLVKRIAPIGAQIICLNVYKQFQENFELQSLAIVDTNRRPIGMVYRDQLAELMSTNYGHALFDKKPVASIMNPITISVELSDSIDDVSNQISDNEQFDLRPEFVVVLNGIYMGLVNVRSLLKKMTEEKIKNAQHANPLTMLPGNMVIQRKIEQIMPLSTNFSLAYFDLDHFKPFNDLYGYAIGDEAIKMLATIIKDNCKTDFVGHVGGDDFVVLFTHNSAVETCYQIIEQFTQQRLSLFKNEDIQRQGYFSAGRDGKMQFFPLLSLSCGVIQPDLTCIKSHHEIATLASEAKKKAKQAPVGNVYIHNKCA